MSGEIENYVASGDTQSDPCEQEISRVSAEMHLDSCSFERIEPELKHRIKTQYLDLKITVCIHLSVDEVAGLRDPVPYYVTRCGQQADLTRSK